MGDTCVGGMGILSPTAQVGQTGFYYHQHHTSGSYASGGGGSLSEPGTLLEDYIFYIRILYCYRSAMGQCNTLSIMVYIYMRRMVEPNYIMVTN
jgi:hypothetical protein